MTIKREAAFHEAGHAVVAYFSKFHRLVNSIDLEQYGAGEIDVSLSISKLSAAGLPAEASSARRPEVAIDLAIVLCAGLVSEKLAEGREANIKANANCAIPDHTLMRQVLKDAGLSQRFDRHELKSKELLEQNWSIVADLAKELYSAKSMEATSIEEFIGARA